MYLWLQNCIGNEKEYRSPIYWAVLCLQIINDSLSLISLGKKYHVIPIAGQLRAILIKDKQTPVPLYYAIQKILEVKQCIYLSTIPEKIKISKDCECYFNVMNVSLERDKLHYQKEDIGKWLDVYKRQIS